MDVVKVEQVFKSYDDVDVLKGINLAIHQGEIVSVVGASGAGKTTFLQLIGTLDTIDKGEIFIDDIPVSRLSGGKLAEFRNTYLGFIFQFHQLLPEFTALENVCIPGYISGKNWNDVNKEAKNLLSFLGMQHRLNHKPSQLSGGEQQRVAVARSLINKPKVILGDEPSGNLDSKNARELNDLFKKLRDEFGHTFIIVTHNKDLAAESDRIFEITDGVISD